MTAYLRKASQLCVDVAEPGSSDELFSREAAADPRLCCSDAVLRRGRATAAEAAAA